VSISPFTGPASRYQTGSRPVRGLGKPPSPCQRFQPTRQGRRNGSRFPDEAGGPAEKESLPVGLEERSARPFVPGHRRAVRLLSPGTPLVRWGAGPRPGTCWPPRGGTANAGSGPLPYGEMDFFFFFFSRSGFFYRVYRTSHRHGVTSDRAFSAIPSRFLCCREKVLLLEKQKKICRQLPRIARAIGSSYQLNNTLKKVSGRLEAERPENGYVTGVPGRIKAIGRVSENSGRKGSAFVVKMRAAPWTGGWLPARDPSTALRPGAVSLRRNFIPQGTDLCMEAGWPNHNGGGHTWTG